MNRGRELIKKMIEKNIWDSENEKQNFSNFLSEIGYTDQNKTTFWKDLINDLQKDQGSDGTVPRSNEQIDKHPYPIREIDTLIEKSLFNIITHLCDLSTEDDEETKKLILSNLYQLIRDDETKSFWNQSVQELSNIIENFKNPENNPVIIPIDEQKSLRLEDFKNADAGANYDDETKTEIVEPFINIDGDTYSEIRGTDKVNKAAAYLDKVDFTNNHSDWITLIMPTYSRCTKIEDLNRNFWVIAEAIDGISSWVMDGSTLQQILKKFLDEITQLWENCLYLWMHIALMNQKKSENIFTISEFIKATDYEHLTHYDNIPKITCKIEGDNFIINESKIYDLNQIEKNESDRIRYYSELYSQSVFGFLPIYRVNNYYHNYYSGEWYKNFYIWNTNNIDENGEFDYEKYELVEVYTKRINNTDQKLERQIVISPQYNIDNRFANRIFASRFDKNKYYYSYPFTKVKSLSFENPLLLYGCLKVIPEIDFELGDKKGINIKNFNLRIYDAAAPIVIKKEREIGYFTFKEIDNENKKIKLEYKTVNFNQEEILELQTKYCSEILKSYYLGDVASWKNRIPINWD